MIQVTSTPGDTQYDFAYISTVTGDLSFARALAFSFQEVGARFVVVTPNWRDYRLLRAAGVDSVYVGLRGARSGRRARVSTGLAAHVACERSYFGLPTKFLESVAAHLQSRMTDELSRLEIGCVLQSLGGELVRGIAAEYCQQQGIPEIYFGEHHAGGSILYTSKFKKIASPTFQIEPKAAYHDAGTGPVKVYERNHGTGAPPRMQHKILSYLKHFDLYPVWSAVGYRYKLLTSRMLQAWARLYSTKSFPAGEFVFIPLNVGAESELFIRNPKHTNQSAFVSEIRKSFPDRFKIAIKGHPGVSTSFGFTDPIRYRLAGIHIFDSEIPASKIVPRASAVAFVSSTVGLEAIQKGVPIYVGGNWAYGELAEAYASDAPGCPEARWIQAESFASHLKSLLFPGSSFGSTEELKTLVTSIAASFK